jgi:hypothetical protein
MSYPPEMNAIGQGRQAAMNKIALSGLLGNSQSPVGSTPTRDPAAAEFQQALLCLRYLEEKLAISTPPERRNDAVEVKQIAVDLQKMSIDRQDDFIKMAQQQAGRMAPNQFPNINAMGAGSV